MKKFIKFIGDKIMISIVDDVVEKISKTTFKLPDNVGSINVSNQPD